jgi:hypothetical protein
VREKSQCGGKRGQRKTPTTKRLRIRYTDEAKNRNKPMRKENGQGNRI